MIMPADFVPTMPGCYSSSGKPGIERQFPCMLAATFTETPSISRTFPEACYGKVDYHRTGKANSEYISF